MGCTTSTTQQAVVCGQTIAVKKDRELDDSIHRMILRDQEKLLGGSGAGRGTGGSSIRFKPRQPHDFGSVTGNTVVADEYDNDEDPMVDDGSYDSSCFLTETAVLLYHSAHHGATIDARDMALVARGRGG